MSVSNTYQVKVDIKKKPTTKAPEVIANDKVVFEVEVFDNGTLFPLDENYIYYLVSKSYKKDANAVIRQGTLTNGKIVFALGSSEFEHIGKVEATVQIFDSTNKRVSTAYFDYKVVKDNSFDGELPNDDKNLVIVNESLLSDISEQLADVVKLVGLEPVINDTLDNLLNPFKRTKIKLLGDSITAGLGGSGYSATGEAISDLGKENIPTAKCWANSLKSYLETKYPKYEWVGLNDSRINLIGDGVSIEVNVSSSLKVQAKMVNETTTNKITFTFYGDKFKLLHHSYNASGIVSIVVDSVQIATLDCYSEEFTWNIEKEYTVPNGFHTVEIIETNTRNSQSTGNRVYIAGIQLPKNVLVKNWGISGINTEYVYNNRAKLIESDDEIIILQIGTNDRAFNKLPTSTLLREIVKYVEGLNKRIILMCAPPASVTDENKRVRKMEDINKEIKLVASEMNIGVISNYDFIQRYMEMTNKTIEELTTDGLHPNDFLYDILFTNIIKRMNL